MIKLDCSHFVRPYSTVIAIRGKDGVVFAVEKLVQSKLYERGANKRIFNIDKHIGMVSAAVAFLQLSIHLFTLKALCLYYQWTTSCIAFLGLLLGCLWFDC